jgi:anti-sigma regulatory factor (Ser/Thr protein kinase)
VSAYCRTHQLGHLADDAALLTSELVANAVQHASGVVGLTAQCTDDGVTIRVTDDDGDALPSQSAASDVEEHGRGLTVVAALAGDWGTAHDGNTKSVWFRLP